MNVRRFVWSIFAATLLSITACNTTPAESGHSTHETHATGAATGPVSEVQLSLSEFDFEASQTTFSSGETYRLVVTNRGQMEHELMITPVQATGLTKEQLHERSLALIHGLAPGQTETIDVTFPDGLGEAYEFSCYIPGHYEAGMKLAVAIGS